VRSEEESRRCTWEEENEIANENFMYEEDAAALEAMELEWAIEAAAKAAAYASATAKWNAHLAHLAASSAEAVVAEEEGVSTTELKNYVARMIKIGSLVLIHWKEEGYRMCIVKEVVMHRKGVHLVRVRVYSTETTVPSCFASTNPFATYYAYALREDMQYDAPLTAIAVLSTSSPGHYFECRTQLCIALKTQISVVGTDLKLDRRSEPSRPPYKRRGDRSR
jgi:hypothetical protein